MTQTPEQPNQRGVAGEGVAGWMQPSCGDPWIGVSTTHPLGRAKEIPSQLMVTSEAGAEVDGGRVPTVVAVVAGAATVVVVEPAPVVVGPGPVEVANTEQPDKTAITNKNAIAEAGPATRSRARETRILTGGTLTYKHRGSKFPSLKVLWDEK